MNVVYKEDPKEWRKTACLTAIGLGVLSSLLRWRRHVSNISWGIALGIVALVVIAAFVHPRWFRDYYRFSQKLGFQLSQFLGRIVLAAFFILILTPLGIFRRGLGYDPLQLKRPPKDASCWKPVKKPTPLERLF